MERLDGRFVQLRDRFLQRELLSRVEHREVGDCAARTCLVLQRRYLLQPLLNRIGR